MAHRGVLFLDELPEFERRALEALREPLETGEIRISRAAASHVFPARFQLIAAMNPCPCGHFEDTQKACTCSHQTVTRYQKRISGPMLDRIDIHIEVPKVEFDKLTGDRTGEASVDIQCRVENAREHQRGRFMNNNLVCNADMGPREVQQYCDPGDEGISLLRQAMKQLNLTARGYHRVLKLARTIADLSGVDQIIPSHLAEALQYRPRRWVEAGHL